MSAGTICLLISAGIMIIVTIYLDIVGEQVAEIKEIAEEQGWCDPAKVQELGDIRQPRRRKATPAAEYFIMPDGEKIRKR